MSTDPSICVYIIDDDESVRRALKMVMLAADLDAKTFDSGQAFLQSDFRRHGTCLVTDFKMPGIDGLGILRQLTKLGKRIPVIFLTASDSSEDRKRAISSGAIGFFRKPVDDQALLDTIQWALSSSSTTPERA